MLVALTVCFGAAIARADATMPLGGDTFGAVVFDTIGLPGDHAVGYRRLYEM
ncbi:MAG: hypothetical protein QOH86_792, partial [Sphingomonadales bacterium]|nr:hypothetical protein [Sphingomonadales bacterium]